MDGLDEDELQKRRKVHRLSGVTVARFSQHYDDHGDLLKTQSPAPTFDKKLRYSREAHVSKPCHWKPKKSSGPEMYDAALQAALIGPSYDKHAQFDKTTRDAIVQTKAIPKEVPVQISTRDAKVQCTIEVKPVVVEKLVAAPALPAVPTNNYDDLRQMLQGMKQGKCPGTHIPDGMVQQVAAALAELAVLLKALAKRSDIIDGKEDDIMRELVKKGGSNISESTIQHILKILKEIHEFMRRFKNFDDSKLIDFMNARINQLQVIIQELKKDHAEILRAIESNKQPISTAQLPEQWMMDVHGFLREILSILKITSVEDTTYMEPIKIEFFANCTCSELVQRTLKDPKYGQRNFIPGLCQRCINDHRGREFLKNLNLPVPTKIEIINLMGNTISSIMDNETPRVKVLMAEFRRVTPEWKNEEYQICLEALFHLSLIWDRQECAQYLVTVLNIPEMYMKIAANRRVFNICDFIKSSAEAQNPEVLRDLLKSLGEREKIIVINSPAIYENRRTLSLFEAARRGDVKCFEILVDQGAELDLLENGERSILHELVCLSDIKDELDSAALWEQTLYNMLDVIYNKTSKWWERYYGKSEYNDGTSASRKSALQYLFLHVRDKNGLNVMEYAGEHATRYMMKYIINNPPFLFYPDPFGLGYHSGEVGYLMTGIDSCTLPGGISVLERIMRRKPRDAGPVLRLEPFYSLIQDKWARYKPFYFILLIAYLAYMAIFTACAFTRPSPNENTYSEMYSTREDTARLIGEIFCLVCLPLFLYGEFRDIYRGRWRIPPIADYFGIFRGLNILFVIFAIVLLILRCLANDNEDAIFSVCLLIGWTNATQFLAAWKSTGIFPIAMSKVIRNNFFYRFFPTYIIILLALSSSTFVNYQFAPTIVDPYTNETFLMTPFTLFKMSFALQNADHVGDARVPVMGYLLFIVFVCIGIILMFYLLLAMMADTFRSTVKILLREWIHIRLQFSMYIETRLPAVFQISYEPDGNNKSSILGDPKLRYVLKIERRRNKNGGVVETPEMAVLIPREDPPIPERIGDAKKPLVDLEDVYRKNGKGRMLPGKVKPHTDLTIIDLTRLAETNRDLMTTYESLGTLDIIPSGKTVLHGAYGTGKGTPKNTTEL